MTLNITATAMDQTGTQSVIHTWPQTIPTSLDTSISIIKAIGLNPSLSAEVQQTPTGVSATVSISLGNFKLPRTFDFPLPVEIEDALLVIEGGTGTKPEITINASIV